MKKQLIIIGIIIFFLTVGLSGCNSDIVVYTYEIQYELKNQWQSDKYIEIIENDSGGGYSYGSQSLTLGNSSLRNETLFRKSDTITFTLTIGLYNETAPRDSKNHFIQSYAINLSKFEWVISNKSPIKFIILINKTGNISVEKE